MKTWWYAAFSFLICATALPRTHSCRSFVHMYTCSLGRIDHVHCLPSCAKYFLRDLYFLPRLRSLTAESSVIVAALQKSKTGLLEISEDKMKVRRSPTKPLPEVNDEYKDALKHKSVYIVSCFFQTLPRLCCTHSDRFFQIKYPVLVSLILSSRKVFPLKLPLTRFKSG